MSSTATAPCVPAARRAAAPRRLPPSMHRTHRHATTAVRPRTHAPSCRRRTRRSRTTARPAPTPSIASSCSQRGPRHGRGRRHRRAVPTRGLTGRQRREGTLSPRRASRGAGLRPPGGRLPRPRHVRGGGRGLRDGPENRARERAAQEGPRRPGPGDDEYAARAGMGLRRSGCAHTDAKSILVGRGCCRSSDKEDGYAKTMNQMNTLFQTPDLIQRIISNPKTAPYLAQPDFVQAIKELQNDGSTISKCVLGQARPPPRSPKQPLTATRGANALPARVRLRTHARQAPERPADSPGPHDAPGPCGRVPGMWRAAGGHGGTNAN